LGAAAASLGGKDSERVPLSDETARQLLLRKSFPGTDSRHVSGRVAYDFIEDELWPLLNERLNILDWSEYPDDITAPCLEVITNMMRHAGGGELLVYLIENTDGSQRLEVIAEDKGPGIVENLHDLLKQSIEAHTQQAYDEVHALGEQVPVREHMGMKNIVLFPDEATYETNGEKWVKVGETEDELALRCVDTSEITEGVKATLVWKEKEGDVPGVEPTPVPDVHLGLSPDKSSAPEPSQTQRDGREGKRGDEEGITEALLGKVHDAFQVLEQAARDNLDLNTWITRLSSRYQKKTEVTKLRLCLPVEVLKNSGDITLALRNAKGLKDFTETGEEIAIPFELVVTGVKKEDVQLINSLNLDEVRGALELPEESRLTIVVVEEDDIKNKVDAAHDRIGNGLPEALLRIDAIKGILDLSQCPESECTAIATGAMDQAEIRRLEGDLTSAREENVSILVLTAEEGQKIEDTNLFSLSRIVNDWLENIQRNEKALLIKIEAIIPYSKELEQAITAAWQTLRSA
ncbi:MAG: hypothetical protein HQ579_07425, partial [Candidatus Omnitrophica bacterium]|nr:hypothetical protein [Candidatus Omnitrophota bacterium]